jgi:hypothetical protein
MIERKVPYLATITCAPCGASFRSPESFAAAARRFSGHECPERRDAFDLALLRRVSAVEILRKRTPAGSWTRAQLAEWGVPWPPPKGWRARLEGRSLP